MRFALLLAVVAVAFAQLPPADPVSFSVGEELGVSCSGQMVTRCSLNVLNNIGGAAVELTATAIDINVVDGAIVGGTSFVDPDVCVSSVQIPNIPRLDASSQQNYQFSGTAGVYAPLVGWTSSGISGGVILLNSTLRSVIAPPALNIWRIVLSGSGAQSIFGTVNVLATSGVRYQTEFCCGAQCTRIPVQAPACQTAVDFNSVECPVVTNKRNVSHHAEERQTSQCNTYINEAGFIPWNLPSSAPTGTSLFGSTLDLSTYSNQIFTITNGDRTFNNRVASPPPTAGPSTDLTVDGLADLTDRAGVGFTFTNGRNGTYNVELWAWDGLVPNQQNVNVFWGPYVDANTPNGPIRSTITPNPSIAGSFPMTVTAGTTYFIRVKPVEPCSPSASCVSRINGVRMTYVDTTNPVLTCADATQYIAGPTSAGCVVDATYNSPRTATDNCPLPQVVRPTLLSGVDNGTPTVGPVLITNYFALTDTNQNTGTCSFTLTIVDQDPPSFFQGCPADVTLEADSMCTATVTWTNPPVSRRGCTAVITATDNGVEVFSGGSFSLGPHTIVLTASDIIRRTASCSFSATVIDTQPPIVHWPARTVDMRCGPSYRSWLENGGFATVTDNCPLTFSYSGVPGHCGKEWDAPPTYTSANFFVTDGTFSLPLSSGIFTTHDGSCTCDNRITLTPDCRDTRIGATPILLNVTNVGTFGNMNPPVYPLHYHWSTGATTQWIYVASGSTSYSVTVYDHLQKVGFATFTADCRFVSSP